MKFDLPDLDIMLETAIEAARIAGQMALNAITNTEVSIKNGDEIVTQMDPLCQDAIIEHIKMKFPNHAFIAEECKNGELLRKQNQNNSNIWWVIDPIDGTNNYAHQLLDFTVSIAAVMDGCPIVAVVYFPAAETTFAAVKGKQTTINGEIVSISNEDINRYAHISIDSHWPDGIPEEILKLIRQVKFRNLGTTALHLAYVATGSLIAAITNTTKLWDIAAGILLIESAGGIVTDWQGKPIFPLAVEEYKKEDFKLVAANRKVHHKILNIIQPTKHTN